MGTPGSYVLVLTLGRPTALEVGRLGMVTFDAGYYCYVGSARGPGGLSARLARHLRQSKSPHWHIDYLLQRAVVVEIWTRPSAHRLECAWAQALLRTWGADAVVSGFGSSDCSCKTHLVYFSSLPSLDAFCSRLAEARTESSRCQRAGQQRSAS